MKSIKELEKEYNEKQLKWKTHIRLDNNKFRRFFKWVWFLIAYPWVWLFYNMRDWRSIICVLVSFVLWSASVWVWYLLAIITGWNTNTAKWFIGVGSAVFVWWASPVGSPFILLVTLTAIGFKGILNKILYRKQKHERMYAYKENTNER